MTAVNAVKYSVSVLIMIQYFSCFVIHSVFYPCVELITNQLKHLNNRKEPKQDQPSRKVKYKHRLPQNHDQRKQPNGTWHDLLALNQNSN